MTSNPTDLIERLRLGGIRLAHETSDQAAIRRNNTMKEAANTLTQQESEIEALREGFRVADTALCHAIQTGFYCGEGILEKLVKIRAALSTTTDAPAK